MEPAMAEERMEEVPQRRRLLASARTAPPRQKEKKGAKERYRHKNEKDPLPRRCREERGPAHRLGCRGFLLADRRLAGGETRRLYAERRARNVVKSELVAELHRGGIAAVLAADADV